MAEVVWRSSEPVRREVMGPAGGCGGEGSVTTGIGNVRGEVGHLEEGPFGDDRSLAFKMWDGNGVVRLIVGGIGVVGVVVGAGPSAIVVSGPSEESTV